MAQIIKKQSKKALILFTILIMVFFNYFIWQAKAASVTSRSDTLSTSLPTTAANHTIQFTLTASNGVDEGDTLTITFDSNFDTASIVEDDVDIKDDTVDLTTAADCDGAEQASVVMAADVLTITICAGDGGTIAASSVVEIEVGTNATASGTGANQITNPAAGVYNIDVGGTFGDTGTIQVAVVAGVTASATVSETLTFTVGDMGATCLADHAGSGTDRDATPTTIPFGTVTADAFYNGCQTLTVSTNATSGYNLTIGMSDQMTSGSEQIADGTCDGLCSETAVAPWDTATNNGFGYCMKDSSGNGAETAEPEWASEGCGDASEGFKIIPDTGESETRNAIMSSAGEVVDVAEIDYSLSVDPTQPAGTYTTTITYVVTPTY